MDNQLNNTPSQRGGGVPDHIIIADDTMEQGMDIPTNCGDIYHATIAACALQRSSIYIWPHPQAVVAPMALPRDTQLPETLIAQCLGGLYPRIGAGQIAPIAADLALAAVEQMTQDYVRACST
ncbi:hypothetical protein [Paracoccus sp. JM45]|uniref:hypothetical protein n=1 Tax=Paracoccus sp. JM45 TaxID=2283626 RepID=UPI0011C423D5|nr:hypothetical protein [Paracoccus sp. JM45]